MQKICRRFRVTGRVQGVWFRKSTQSQAKAQGLQGWAINLADGSVEVCLYGSSTGVEKLAAWLHQGPAAAKVDAVEELDPPEQLPEAAFSTG